MAYIRCVAAVSLGITMALLVVSCGSNSNTGPALATPSSLSVGQPCNLTADAGPSQAVVNTASGVCPSSVCVKPVDQGFNPPSPPTGATCTAECNSDSDCLGETRDSTNSTDTRCKNGFVCGIPFAVGPLCCKKYCMCRDFLSSAGVSTPLACTDSASLAACHAEAGHATSPVGQETDVYVNIAPVRKLDLVFMIDNSPSMAPKVDKLNKQFPKLIAALKDPADGTYPDLRVALIDSDLGTGGQYNNGNSCSPNDSNGHSPYGDLGNFQMRGKDGTKGKGTDCGMSSADSLWIEYTQGRPMNYNGNGDAINSVFACLATNLGTSGCGEEHQLQTYEFAFYANSYHTDVQNSFIRPEADLGLVFLSDEDDCSAATNDGMFGDVGHSDLLGESASLRCATRGHACAGVGNLSQNGPHYPTDSQFETDFTSCSARSDSCPNNLDGLASTDTTGPTSCTPLRSIKAIADRIKSLKGDRADEKILVAGIFGWPLTGSDGKPDFAHAEKYKIDKVPNQNTADTAHPAVYDYWPLCYDPDHRPKVQGQYDADAWGYGAAGGLRLSAFIDEFGPQNGLKYSICERDFTNAMQRIGTTLARRLQDLCVDAKLMDTDPTTPEPDPDCRVAYRVPVTSGTTVTYKDSTTLPLCPSGATPDTISSDCWHLVVDREKCPVNGQLIEVVRTRAEMDDGPLAAGTKVSMQCWTCPDGISTAGCNY